MSPNLKNYHICALGGNAFGSTLLYIGHKLNFPTGVAVLSGMVELRQRSELKAVDNLSGVLPPHELPSSLRLRDSGLDYVDQARWLECEGPERSE